MNIFMPVSSQKLSHWTVTVQSGTIWSASCAFSNPPSPVCPHKPQLWFMSFSFLKQAIKNFLFFASRYYFPFMLYPILLTASLELLKAQIWYHSPTLKNKQKKLWFRIPITACQTFPQIVQFVSFLQTIKSNEPELAFCKSEIALKLHFLFENLYNFMFQ